MLQWVALACSCLMLSDHVLSSLTHDPDQRSFPTNATASQRALSVFSVVKVRYFFLFQQTFYPLFSFPTQRAPPPQRAGMGLATPALSAHHTGKYILSFKAFYVYVEFLYLTIFLQRDGEWELRLLIWSLLHF